MMQSIRWRLVMGAMLLTLLTVSAVGVVALLLMQRYMVQQERAYLAANAQAIAQQAVTFMSPVHMSPVNMSPMNMSSLKASPPLQQLAQTAAFLGDVTVRIVDQTQMPLADSAVALPYSETVGLAAAPIYFRVDPLAYPPDATLPPAVPDVYWTTATSPFTVGSAVPMTAAMPEVMPASAAETMAARWTKALPPTTAGEVQATNVIVVQKSPSIWGDRLTFDAATGSSSRPISQTISVIYAQGQAVPDGASHAGATLATYGATYGEDVLVDAKLVDVEKWQKPGMAQPSFLQAAGFAPADVVTAPIHAGGTVVGFVELARATNLVDEPLGAIRRALAIAAGASALLAMAVGLVMSSTLTAPIQNLAEAAAAMSSGDLTARAPVVGQDELASLARQFNQMADALHHSFAELAAERDTLRRFVADASHELRTPITALRTFNELLQGPARGDRAVQAEFLAESDAQIARLEWITRNLLDLSRWDGGMATLVKAEVEVGELVMAAAAPFRALAQERQIGLHVVTPESPILAQVDEQRLGMAVGNLLDNAIKFTPDAGKVTVGVKQDDQGVKIWVEDTGMGICAKDLPHIFARFYRSPRATQAGSGLGLAIVERIVNAHGATIGVESKVGAGSRFTLCLGLKSDIPC